MPRKLTIQEFIQKARKIHKNIYDYSKVSYMNSKTKVEIVCQKHGSFWQTPNHHLNNRGCPECANKKRSNSNSLTTKEFIERARAIHGNKYDYSKINYINYKTKIEIKCLEHGSFWQTPHNHLKGNGCYKCAGNQKLTTKEFIKKARAVHENKYDYSRVNYINSHTKVKIVCKKHGVFEQRPYDHLNGHGCSKCYGNKKLILEEFIKRARYIHGDKYDYSQVDYKNNHTKIKIICTKHGIFEQRPHDHLSGHGCPKCPVTISKPEQELADYISSLGYEIIQSYRGWYKKRPQLEIDIFIPELNLGLEFNGNYWHSKKQKNYHKEKTLLALNNNIKLIHIWENKWINKKESVKRMIKQRLENQRWCCCFPEFLCRPYRWPDIRPSISFVVILDDFSANPKQSIYYSCEPSEQI